LILGTLNESDDPNKLKRSVQIASKHAKRLYRLVNQLLDFQKVALSKIKLRTERVDLLSFLESLSLSVQDACLHAQLSFKMDNQIPAQGKAIVKGQLDALEKILFNYIGNAMKFTPPGGEIRLTINQRGGFIRIGVKDSGCGIPLDQQDKLFKLFSQIEGPQQEGKQGTGIGLALVKELAQQMGGRVGVESSSGDGACFWLEMPRLITAAESHSILYVDTDPRYGQAMQTLFAKHQLDSELVCVTDIENAADIIRNYPVQVLMVSAGLGKAIAPLMQLAMSEHPDCWRVMMFDKQAHVSSKSLSTHGIQSIHDLPAGEEFVKELLMHFIPHNDQSEMPVLDLVYIEDEETVRVKFAEALARHTLIERFEILTDFAGYKQLVKHYRVKVLICDANLGAGEKGLDVLAFSAFTSPDTIRILFTGQATTDLLASSIQTGQVHYIIYKPMNFEKELAVIEDYVRKSPLHTPSILPEAMITQKDWHLADFAAITPPTVEEQQSITPSSSKGANILIVDDIRDMRMILSDILHEAGYAVVQADHGESALKLLQNGQQRVDLIVCDWMMPVKTGIDLLAELHRIPELASIPFILLTAKSDDQSRSLGLKIGASAYLSKPFDRLEVLSVVENLLELKRRERQLSELNDFINHNVLQRFLPPDLVKDLVAGKAVFDDAAKLQPITVLFADLCNFTRSTEQLGPTKLARILNSFLIRMTDVIFEEGGTIDKFIGDAILVFFGAPSPLDPINQIRKAQRCALRMQSALRDLNKEWIQTENHQFEMRIGIHHGPAIVGSFGGRKRSDYTAIGQTVNIASRIEAQAKPGEILVTGAIRDYLEEGQWECVGAFPLKGVAGEVTLYRIIGELHEKAA